LPHNSRPESAAGPGLSWRGCCSGTSRPVVAGALLWHVPACLRACRRDRSGSASRCAFAAARPPWLASLSARPRWRGVRWRPDQRCRLQNGRLL